MRDFSLHGAGSAGEATRLLSSKPGARLMAGGTDLIPLLKDDILDAERVVALQGSGALRAITEVEGSLHIGALVTLSEIASDPLIQARYGALAQACRLAASPQLRNMGTIGGNLMQQTRCWYYRGPAQCWLKGGATCYARSGENELHSIYLTDLSPCVSAHPSDPAAALFAFGASVQYQKQRGEDAMELERLYRLPSERDRGFWRLPQGAVITSVVLPPVPDGARSIYKKAMSRAAWSFALAGLAVSIADQMVRIALSGVAPIPVRVSDAERYLAEKGLDGADAGELGELVVAKARPLAKNGYKVALLRGLVAEALEELRDSLGG